MQKGFKHTKETREKMRLAALRRDNSKRIAAMPKGKDHWAWTENPNKLTLHKRIHRKYGAAKNYDCECGKKAHDWSCENGNYTDNIKDYKPRCRSCHVKKDQNWIKKS